MRQLCIIFTTLIWLTSTSDFIKAEAPRSNVVLIMIDDLSHYGVSAYGSKSYQTPNMDRLAAEGMRFDRCFALPLCTPSRVEIMTGVHNGRNYETGQRLDESQVTFANVIQQAGYRTGISGKWKLGKSSLDVPNLMGFDEYCLYDLTQPAARRYKNPLIDIDQKRHRFKDGEYGPDIVCDYALEFIERHKDEPFLFYYPMILVHAPHVPTPDSDEGAYRSEKEDDRYFSDMVGYADKNIGRIVAKLDELKLRHNTLLIVSADNGNKKVCTVTLNDGTRYGGGKGDTSDTGTHVPLIVNQPGVVPSGTTNDDLIDFADIFPTVCEACGASIPEPLRLDGVSFYPQIRGQEGQPREWIYDWYRNQPEDRLAEYAYTKEYKLYRDGRFFAFAEDVNEDHPLDHSKLTDDQKRDRDLLADVLERHRETPVASVTSDTSELTLGVGASRQLQVKVKPENATKRSLRWQSSAPQVATVNKWGLVTAHKPGKAEISISSFDGSHTAVVAIRVK